MIKTAEWQRNTGQKCINFFIGKALLDELDALKEVTFNNRSEMIRNGIRMYIQQKKNALVDLEKRELEAYHLRERNRRAINYGGGISLPEGW